MALLLGSCTKEGGTPAAHNVRVTFVVDAPATKGALSPGGETSVQSLDLLVFRADGALESHVRVGSELSVEASLITGEELTYYIVANLPASRLAAVADRSEFLSTLTYLSDTAMGSMVMSGSGTLTLDGLGDVEVGPVGLDHYACKISITDITVSWLSSFSTAPSCVVNRILVMNARTVVPLSGTATAAADAYWVNKLTDEEVDPATMVGHLVYANPALAVLSSAKTSLGATLFAMPNASAGDENASDTPWAPRRTRICVELLIDGHSNWYPIDLPAMERNAHYVVSELVIMGPGTTAPDMGIDRTAVAFGVEVAPWTENAVNAGTYPMQNMPKVLGRFTIDQDGTTVGFAPGNLQCTIASGPDATGYNYAGTEWRFAQNQWDYLGNTDGANSFTVGKKMDLFGWVGASAANDTYGLCSYTGSNNSFYGTSSGEDLYTDWGNIPEVEQNLGPGWFTLTTAQWDYIFNSRAGGTVGGNTSARWTQATIRTDFDGIYGIILFPNGCFIEPSEFTTLGLINVPSTLETTCNADQWEHLADKGCVFLPSAGERSGVNVNNINNYGLYWSSSGGGLSHVQSLLFHSGSLNTQNNNSRYNGSSVRLVKNID